MGPPPPTPNQHPPWSSSEEDVFLRPSTTFLYSWYQANAPAAADEPTLYLGQRSFSLGLTGQIRRSTNTRVFLAEVEVLWLP